VGTRPAGASPHGALDMVGSVWEWVQDFYGSGYYAGSPDTDPRGPATGVTRVMRGGYFDNGPINIRVTVRGGDAPADGFAYAGFRCARAAASP
jgi:formylglycine-generating enzyme required for sulfatase activity